MGRVQNAFSFVASALQICTALLVGEAAHRDGLIYGFWIVGAMYLGAAFAAWLPVRHGAVDPYETNDTRRIERKQLTTQLRTPSFEPRAAYNHAPADSPVRPAN